MLDDAAFDVGAGSSPQARGTHEHLRPDPTPDRFIPAGAGNTDHRISSPARCPVHPRRRGEHLEIPFTAFEPIGSSPQARGTHLIRVGPFPTRFIPAGAGNTTARRSHAAAQTVHPRRRGEHAIVGCFIVGTGGSSPQARGTLDDRDHVPIAYRFIPAGAGNTRVGSSPQARGTRGGKLRTNPLRWFIPAGAGNTFVSVNLPAEIAVHPRRRGEHSILCLRTGLQAVHPRRRGEHGSRPGC